MFRKLCNWAAAFLLVFGVSVVALPGHTALAAGNSFYDTFDAGNGNWSEFSGSWSVSGGSYIQSTTTNGTYFTGIKDKRWGDATYDFDLKVVNNGGSNLSWAGLQFKKMIASDNPFESGFMLYIRANGSVELYKVNKVLISASTGIDFSTFRHVRVVNSGANIKVYVNNETTPRIDYNDATFASGYAGLVVSTSSWHFDNVSVSGPDLPYTINVGDADLLYTDAQMQITMDSTFGTMKDNDDSMNFYHGPYSQHFRGPSDDPMQTYVSSGGEQLIDKNGHEGDSYRYHIWIMNYYKIGPNELIGFTHNERWPAGQTSGIPKFSLGVAYSNDNGATWEFCGEMLKPYNEDLNVGGTPIVIIGDYIYAYYNDGVNNELGAYPRHIAVARADLQDVIAAARNLQNTTWTKYSNGSWSGNAFTSLGDRIIDNTYGKEDTHSDATFNTAINKYLMTIQTHDASKLTLYSSSDGINWSMEAIVDSVTAGSVMQPYSTFVDYVGGAADGTTVDGNFDIIYPRKAWSDYTIDNLYRRSITITTNQTDRYSASGGFSQTQGVNQWSYEQWNGTAYSNMTWDSGNNRWKGAQDNVIIGSSWQHPDTNDSVRTWTAPKLGVVNVAGLAKKASNSGFGDGVNVRILKNGTQIWPSSGWQSIAYNNFTGVSHNLTVSVAPNDQIRFIVNKNGTNSSDTTHWDPTIEYENYSASSGFSSAQGTNQWYYKQWNGSSYSDMTWDAVNNRWNGAQTYVIVGSNWQHPDTNDSVRAWKAPSSGTVRLTGTAKKDSNNGLGDGVNVKIMKNGTQVWPSSGWEYIAANNFVGASHDISIPVEANDFIYFVVNKNGTITSDTMVWDPTVRYTGVEYNSFSATSGFSSVQETNQWSYKQWNGTSYSDMTWDTVNNRWKGAQTYALVGYNWQHPDTNDSVRAWKAPKAGTVQITGNAKKDIYNGIGDGVNVKIMKNGTQVWPASGWQAIAANNFVGFSHDISISVAANDLVYFVVNKNGTNTGDTTVWTPTVLYTGL
ncbi:hypothetical protein [Cohnella silvisoli]|uniref:DUF1080 domain-containing protein n=1 Tax=Cohnella silvisoli TaxID=2873699 RepID=A0ABV1KWI9_9BACL|nr:hypothetical protein [Cohnella silvisoli]MCD9023749.1 hypothetical protein [Cohnella silvisoli]